MIEFATGLRCILIVIAAIALGARCSALSPKNSTFPPGPPLARLVMFLYAVALVTLAGALSADPHAQTSPIVLVAAGLHAVYHVTMAANVLRQNYPPRVWAALRKIQALASCRRPDRVPLVVERGVTEAFAAEGAVFVSGPGESTAQALNRRAPRHLT